MIGDVGVFLQVAVVLHLSVGSDKRNSKVRHIVRLDIRIQRLLRVVGEKAQVFLHTRVVVLKLQVKCINLILLLSCLLKHDESHSKDKEYRQYTEVEFGSDGYSHSYS